MTPRWELALNNLDDESVVLGEDPEIFLGDRRGRLGPVLRRLAVVRVWEQQGAVRIAPLVEDLELGAGEDWYDVTGEATWEPGQSLRRAGLGGSVTLRAWAPRRTPGVVQRAGAWWRDAREPVGVVLSRVVTTLAVGVGVVGGVAGMAWALPSVRALATVSPSSPTPTREVADQEAADAAGTQEEAPAGRVEDVLSAAIDARPASGRRERGIGPSLEPPPPRASVGLRGPPGYPHVVMGVEDVRVEVEHHWPGVDPEFVERVGRIVDGLESGRSPSLEAMIRRLDDDPILDFVIRSLADAHLDPWYGLLVLTESHACPAAVSPTGAVGPWQFIASTANRLVPELQLTPPDAESQRARISAAGDGDLSLGLGRCPVGLLRNQDDPRMIIQASTGIAIRLHRENDGVVDAAVRSGEVHRGDAPLFTMTMWLQGPAFVEHARRLPGTARWSHAVEGYVPVSGSIEGREQVADYVANSVAFGWYVARRHWLAQREVVDPELAKRILGGPKGG